MEMNLDRVTACLRDLGAAEVAPRFRTLRAGEIAEKAPGDFVTVVDETVERELSRMLPPLLPGSLVVGEEQASREPARLALLDEDRPVWVLDPVDGTRNFVNGVERVAMIIALCRAGTILAGWIHDPLGGTTAVAEAGSGCMLDGARVDALAPPMANGGEGVMGYKLERRLRKRLRAGPVAGAPARVHHFGCTGQEYLSMLSGRLQFSEYGRLKPWDHAAGVLMIREAGGVSRLLDGNDYQPRYMPHGRLLSASDAPTWKNLAELIVTLE